MPLDAAPRAEVVPLRRVESQESLANSNIDKVIDGVRGDLHGVGMFSRYKYEIEKEDIDLVRGWKQETDGIIKETKAMLEGGAQDTREYQLATAALGQNYSEKDLQKYAVATFARTRMAKLPKNVVIRFLAIHKSYITTGVKALAKSKNKLVNFGKNMDGCIDVAVVVKVLTELYGIKGNIRLPDKGGPTPFLHHYWQEEGDGSIIDVNFCPRVNGFVKNAEEYAAEVKRSKEWRKANKKNRRTDKEAEVVGLEQWRKAHNAKESLSSHKDNDSREVSEAA